jgi:hypothetical protein
MHPLLSASPSGHSQPQQTRVHHRQRQDRKSRHKARHMRAAPGSPSCLKDTYGEIDLGAHWIKHLLHFIFI